MKLTLPVANQLWRFLPEPKTNVFLTEHIGYKLNATSPGDFLNTSKGGLYLKAYFINMTKYGWCKV